MPPTCLELEHSAAALDWTHVLSWTLLQSIWIAASAALLLCAGLRLLPTRHCRWRYALCVAALLAVPLIALGALARETLARDSIQWLTQEAELQSASVLPAGFAALRNSLELLRIEVSLRLAPYERGIAIAWIVGVALALARLAGGWLWLRHERASAQRRAAPADQARLARLGRRVGLRQRVPLYWSARSEVPMVVGARRPRIVFPLRLRAALQRGELDSVLLHELAHVSRGDAWLRWLEALLQALFLPNLALHAIASRIEREREHCCDERVLRLGADRLGYVRALAALEQARGPASSALPRLSWLSSPGLRATDGALLERVQRMTCARQPWSRGTSLIAGAALLFGLAGLGLAAVPTHTHAAVVFAVHSSDSADFDLRFAGEPAEFLSAALPAGAPGVRMERVFVVQKPQAAQGFVRARATRLRLDATEPALKARSASFRPRLVRGERIDLRVVGSAR